MSLIPQIFDHFKNMYAAWPDALLTTALLAGAFILIVLALTPEHRTMKAIALAYITLP